MDIRLIKGKPYNDGSGSTNVEIERKADKLQLPNFKYFMRDELIGKKPLDKECGVLNLDSSKNNGTHHTCYWKDGMKNYYFDSFGVEPPSELIKYLRKKKNDILCNTYQIQEYNDSNCSEWCLHVLDQLNKGNKFVDIVLSIINDK